MSWSGFKKAVNRAGNHVIMKTSKNSILNNENNNNLIDNEFQLIEQLFNHFESLIIELNSELSNFKTIFNDLILTQFLIFKSINSFYGEDEEDNKINSFNNKLLENLKIIENDLLPQLIEPFNLTIFQPIEDLNNYNKEIHKLIKKRGRKKFDYEVSNTKLLKLQNDYNSLQYNLRENNESTNDNNQLDKLNDKLNKLTIENNQITNIFIELNQRLKFEIDEFIALRFSLLDPSFESFIKIQLKLFSDISKNLNNNLSSLIDSNSIEDYQLNKIDDRLDEILIKMKSLDIVNI